MKVPTVIPSVRQEVWRWPSIALFVLGGMGSGLYLSSALLTLSTGGPALFAAGPIPYGPAACLTVILGFLLVMGEAGRPLRGPHALYNIRQSWMSREILALLIFVSAVLIDLVTPSVAIRALSAGAAFMLILCQGFIVYESRAMPSWNNLFIPPVFISSGLSSGFGLLFLIADAQPPARGGVPELTGSILLALNLAIFLIYLFSSRDRSFLSASRNLRKPLLFLINAGIGGVLPLLLLSLLLASTERSGIGSVKQGMALIAGVAMIIGGAGQKTSIITAAGFTKGISLDFEGTRSVQKNV